MPPELDPQAIASSIGTELFGSGDNSSSGETGGESLIDGVGSGDSGTPGSGPDLAATNALPTPTSVAPIQGFNGKPLPKSWKKETQPLWEKADPALHDYVYEREANVMRGLQQYQDGYTRWGELTKPFAEVMQRHPDVNPVQLFQNLMHNHMRLLQASPEQKLALVKQLAQGYGVNLDGATPGAQDPRIQSLEAEIRSLRQGFTQTQQAAQERALQENLKVVEAFFSDPKNEFAEELTDNIMQLIQTGAAKDLPSAYEMACWSNPEVRAKLIAKQQEEAAKGQPNGKKQPTNVDDSGSARVTRKSKDWRDDVDSIVSKHFSTH